MVVVCWPSLSTCHVPLFGLMSFSSLLGLVRKETWWPVPFLIKCALACRHGKLLLVLSGKDLAKSCLLVGLVVWVPDDVEAPVVLD